MVWILCALIASLVTCCTNRMNRERLRSNLQQSPHSVAAAHHDDDKDDELLSSDGRHKCCAGYLLRPSISLIILHTSVLSYSSLVKTTMLLLQCRPSPIDNKLIMYRSGSVECYSESYHFIAFLMLPGLIVFPLILSYFARGKSSRSSVGQQLTIVYRTPLIGRWGAAIQMYRRLLLVIVATFTQIPQTVQITLNNNNGFHILIVFCDI
jgi:hypothetical protein